MNLLIAAFGQIKNTDPCYSLYHEYKTRLPWKLDLLELQDKTRNKADSAVILQHIPKASYVIALDEHGIECSSVEFAQQLNKQMLLGKSHYSFIIGSAFGLDKTVLDRANQVMSLGKVTLPHKLARVILIEQLYRAYTIIHNHPYHKI